MDRRPGGGKSVPWRKPNASIGNAFRANSMSKINQIDAARASIGRAVERIEDLRLLRGRGSYVDDLTRPGLLHAVILRSSVAHGLIRSIDASAARALPGVHAVITAPDIAPALLPPPGVMTVVSRFSSHAASVNAPRSTKTKALVFTDMFSSLWWATGLPMGRRQGLCRGKSKC